MLYSYKKSANSIRRSDPMDFNVGRYWTILLGMGFFLYLTDARYAILLAFRFLVSQLFSTL